MPPKKKDNKKKGGGGAEDMTIPPVIDREPISPIAVPEQVPNLVDYTGTPRDLLPVWSDENILSEDWGDPDAEEKFVDKDFVLPSNLATPAVWKRPNDYIKQPAQPPAPELSDEEKAAQEKAKAEAEKKKGKDKKKGKGKGTDSPVHDDPYKIFPDVVITEEEAAWKEMSKDPVAKAKAEEDGASAPEHDGAVKRVFQRGFVRLWSEQQTEDIAKDKAMREDLAIQREKRETERQALLAEAAELGEDPATWLGDFEETEGVKDLEDPPVLELTPQGEEVEAAFAALLRVVFEHADNVVGGDPFLWECIYPQVDGRPIYNPAGKYVLKVFQAGEWRKLVIDDRIPCDEAGNVMLVSSTNPGELWPSLIAKGMYKLYAEQALDTECFTSTIGANAASIAAFTLHTLCGWLPELLPALEDEKGWSLLMNEIPHEKKEHEEEDEGDAAAADADAPADPPADADADADANADAPPAEPEEPPVELTEEEKAAKEAEEAEAKVKADAEALEAARIAALKTKIPLLVTTQPYTTAGDVKTWTDVTSEGEVCKIEEINEDGQVHIITQTGKAMWVAYDEMVDQDMRVLLFHSRYQALNRATMDCHWVPEGGVVEEEPEDPKAKKGKGGKTPSPDPEPVTEPVAEPEEVVFRPPTSDSILCLQVDDSPAPPAEGEEAVCAPEGDTIVVVCLSADGMAAPTDGIATIRLEEESPPVPYGSAVGGQPPAWVTGGIEAPAGEKDMGSFTIGIYTEEQQKRLNVDETGRKVDPNNPAPPNPALLTFQLSTATLQSAKFTVPAGSSKLFQIDVQAPTGYTITFSSSAKLTVLDIAAGRSEQFGVRVVEAEGTYTAAEAGQWSIWTRQVFTLPKAEVDPDADPEAPSEPPKAMMTMAWLQLADKDISAYVTLYTIDNDTAKVTKHPSLSTAWMPCYPNENGYTVIATARCKSRALPPGSWRLCVAGEGDGMADLAEQPSGTINTFSAPYVPNKYLTLFRDVLCTATDPTSLALRLTCSDPSARLRLRVYENPADVEFSLEENEETGEIAPPVVPEKKLLGEVRARGCALMVGINSLEHVLPEVDPKATDAPPQYIVEASIDSERWDVPSKYHSVLPFYRREAAANVPEEESEEGAEQLPPHMDLPEDSDMTWNLQVVSSDALVLRPDAEKETIECMRRQMWEAKEPGRQVLAKISRLGHLGEADKAAALQEALDDSAGGKDKKGKGKDADPDAEEAAAAKMARRAELQAATRAPAIRPCPAAGATILTPEARAELDEARQEVLEENAANYTAQVTARKEVAVERATKLEEDAAGYCAGRVADDEKRMEIYEAREKWRESQKVEDPAAEQV